jgi:hypothetical protein
MVRTWVLVGVSPSGPGKGMRTCCSLGPTGLSYPHSIVPRVLWFSFSTKRAATQKMTELVLTGQVTSLEIEHIVPCLFDEIRNRRKMTKRYHNWKHK